MDKVVEKQVTTLNGDQIEEQLYNLSVEEAKVLINAIRNHITDEGDTPLEGRAADLFEYFKIMPYNNKRLFLYTFNSIRGEEPELCEQLADVYFVFQKKHVAIILSEVDKMPEDFQRMFYNIIYGDFAPNYNLLKKEYNLKQ